MTSSETPPQTFGHYEVEQLLGRGGIGTVYLARDRRIGRRVALKTVQISAQQIEDPTSLRDFYLRLQREAEVCGQLHHPNIVTLYEVGYDGEKVSYLAMELIEGPTLLAKMKAAKPGNIPVDTALAIIADVLRGLAWAHGKGIIHRDVKPANVLLEHDGKAKVADFGIARPVDSSMTGAGSLLGTPNYMSPEQVLARPLTGKADVFSAGTVLYEMLTGVRPFAAKDLTVILHNVLRQTPPHVSDVNPAVPREVGDYVNRLLEKNPEQRWDSSHALTALDALLLKSESKEQKSKITRKTLLPFAFSPLLSPLLIGLIVGSVGIAIGLSRVRSAAKPTVVLPADQVEEFNAKRKALDEADALFEAGKFDQALVRYEEHLKKYPQSVTAREGRDRAREALEPAKLLKKPVRKHSSSKDEDISPSELLRRLKRVFRR